MSRNSRRQSNARSAGEPQSPAGAKARHSPLMTAPSTFIEIVNESGPGASTWAVAKRLVAQVRAGGRAWLELGEVLQELRTEYFAQTVGLRRGNSPSPHDAATGEKGWQAKVREELGISDDTARPSRNLPSTIGLRRSESAGEVPFGRAGQRHPPGNARSLGWRGRRGTSRC